MTDRLRFDNCHARRVFLRLGLGPAAINLEQIVERLNRRLERRTPDDSSFASTISPLARVRNPLLCFSRRGAPWRFSADRGHVTLIVLTRRPMSHPQTLCLFFGGVANEYRLRENRVEFRAGNESWCILSDSDIDLHYRFNTEVAQWLSENQVPNPRAGDTHSELTTRSRKERRELPPFSA